MTAELSAWRDEIARHFRQTSWLLAFEYAAAAAGVVKYLVEIGAPRPLILAALPGSGTLPAPDEAEVFILNLDVGSGMLDAARAFDNAQRDLPAPALQAIQDWDPQSKARVLAQFFASGQDVAGRAFYGRRPQPWQDLEDKTVIDALWDAIGIPRAPSMVVDATLDALQEAAAQLDDGHGTIQVADNREGFNGGASHVRWVRSAQEQEQAAQFFRTSAHRVRVMPFLEGVPCSIHGVVFPDYIAALRPVEMVVLRCPERFQYARAATFWDPDPGDRQTMRALARKTGAYLRDTLGYRGVFTIDGVMTAEGFRPTELNPRFGAALGVMLGPMNAYLQALLMHYALIEGVELRMDPAAWEQVVLTHADAHRSGRVGFISEELKPEELLTRRYVFDEDRIHTTDEESCHAELTLDPMSGGSFLNITLHDQPVGRYVAPRVASVLNAVYRELGSERRFEAARESRRRTPDL